MGMIAAFFFMRMRCERRKKVGRKGGTDGTKGQCRRLRVLANMEGPVLDEGQLRIEHLCLRDFGTRMPP